MDVGGRQRLERVVEVYAAGAAIYRNVMSADAYMDVGGRTAPGASSRRPKYDLIIDVK